MDTQVTGVSEMEYRKLFVAFRRTKGSFLVNVTNDGWFVGCFYSNAPTEKEFAEDCEKYAESDEFKKAMKIVH